MAVAACLQLYSPCLFWDKLIEEWAYACTMLITHHHMQDPSVLKQLESIQNFPLKVCMLEMF